MAKQLHANERFDLVQHITFVSYRQPSFMGNLGIPFVFGPVGGGEKMPPQFRASLPIFSRMAESLRNVGNRLVAFDPLMRRTYASARIIACTTEETLTAIPVGFRDKCIVQRAIGIDEEDSSVATIKRGENSARPQFLFVGRLLYWKGLHLVLRALERVREEIPGMKLRVIGEGGDRLWLKKVAARAKVDDMVEWVARIPHDKMQMEYQSCIGFVFPSLHDSGGMVVLEALAAGVPLICLDLGGPGSIVDSTCGFSLKPGQKNETQIIAELASTMLRLAKDKELWSSLSLGAVKRAQRLTWDIAADAVYSLPALQKRINQSSHLST
jgi:glycosyltransferase involved in cell wall biosynthesis